jgi:RNA polymerase sigma-70 factor (ECF subfamily)
MGEQAADRSEWVREALERYERPLVRYALRLTGDLELARDVVQDTFYKLCAVEPARLNGCLAAWLYTVCRNRAMDLSKRERRTEPLDAERADRFPTRLPSPELAAEWSETRQLVFDAIHDLPDDERECVLMKFQDGFTFREISQITGMPFSTISHRVHRAVLKLSERLRGLELGPAQLSRKQP